MIDAKLLAQANLDVANARVSYVGAQRDLQDAQAALALLQAQDAVATAQDTLGKISIIATPPSPAQPAPVGP